MMGEDAFSELPAVETNTLPGLFVRDREKWRDSAGWCEQKSGTWKEYSWQEGYENAKRFGLGLVSLGLSPGDKVCFQGPPGCRLYWATYGVWGVGGVHVSVPYADQASDVSYEAELTDASFAVARGAQNVDKWLSVREQIPRVKKVIGLDTDRPLTVNDPWLISYDEVVEMGRRYEGAHPQSFERIGEQIGPDELAAIYFTGGSTGRPKGVMHTHRSLLFGAADLQRVFPAGQGDSLRGESIQYGAWIWSLGPQLLKGVSLWCVEDMGNPLAALREISPYALVGTPKQWDVIASAMDPRASGVTYLEVLCRLLLPVCYRVSEIESAGKKPGPFWRPIHHVARWLLAGPALDKVGLRTTRFGIVAGGVARLDTYRLMRAMGFDLRQYYGSSESGMLTAQRKSDAQWHTVGTLTPASEVKIAEDGELLSRHPGQFVGYYKNPTGTQEVLRDGWFHTGDVFTIDPAGHLLFVDRKSALRELSGGRRYSPARVEAQLKAGSYIKDAVALGGDDADYVSALVILNIQTVGPWAQKKGLAYRSMADLSQDGAVAGLVSDIIRHANRDLPGPTRVQKYVILHRDLDANEGELTHRGKLKRPAVEEKYALLVKAIHEGNAAVELQDGTGTFTLKVRSVEEA